MALDRLSEFYRRTGQSILDHPVPHPVVFLNPANELKFLMVLMWLRIRPIFLWRLSLPEAPVFTNKDWRALLEAAHGTTGPSPRRTKMLGKLKEVLKQYHSTGIIIDEDNLASIPATWNSLPVTLDSAGALPSSLVQQVTWELYELQFRLELITLDRYMVPEPQGSGDGIQLERQLWLAREAKVSLCWPGVTCSPRYVEPGFSSLLKQSVRVPYVKAFFELVRAWPGPKPSLLLKPFPTDHGTSLVLEVEDALANYYIRVFVRVFHRPPTIPHIADPVLA